MTPRERLKTVLQGKVPDCVPACPDFSNMIPARLTGKPFWDIYLYNDPPLWEAYLACAKRFDIDALWDAYHLGFDPPNGHSSGPQWERFIVFRNDERIVTQGCHKDNGKRVWDPTVTVYYRADPPTGGVPPEKIGLPRVPQRWEPIEGVKPFERGPEVLKRAKALLGDQGLIGIGLAGSLVLHSEESIFDYYDHPEKYEKLAEELVEKVERKFAYFMSIKLDVDFFSVGGSGTLVFQTPAIFRKLAFPAVKRAIELASSAGYPTHVHSCGPEAQLVKIFAEETGLTVIDPLEVPPMGDCNLAELKRLYGKKIVLKGNLHTTDVMLQGSTEDVIRASKKAIDDGAEGGRFILATGDQCGRDTPDENLRAMVETARSYGRYD
jgi:uroporphyrinogen decarboxylase